MGPEGAGCTEENATWTAPEFPKFKPRPGDWNCQSCGHLNYSSRTECQKCSAPRPDSQIRMGQKPGDWVCPSCGDLNFATRTECRKCGNPKPSYAGIPHQDPAMAVLGAEDQRAQARKVQEDATSAAAQHRSTDMVLQKVMHSMGGSEGS